MANTYYTDFSVVGTGHAGTTLDPFSWADFFAKVDGIAGNGLTSDIHYVKGTYNLTALGTYALAKLSLMDAWITGQPWTIIINNTPGFFMNNASANFKNGIVFSGSSSTPFLAGTFTYMYVQNASSNLGSGFTVDKCTYVCTTGGVTSLNNIHISNSVFHFNGGHSFAGPTNNVINNTYFAGNAASFVSSGSGNTFNWNDSAIVYPLSSDTTLTDYNVLNGFGVGSTGGWASVTPVAPIITLQPISDTTYTGVSYTFNILASGSPTPTYQWSNSNDNISFTSISGATNASYNLPYIQYTDSKYYMCSAINSAGTSASNKVFLTINRNLNFDPISSSATITSAYIQSSFLVTNGQIKKINKKGRNHYCVYVDPVTHQLRISSFVIL